MTKYVYIFSKLTTRQKIIFSLISVASIVIAFTLFGLLLTVLFYLAIFSISLTATLFIYGKIYNFFKKPKRKENSPSQNPKNVIINAEIISVEVNDKKL